MEHLFQKIKYLRQKNNMTLKDLSERTGLSISFLSQIERGSASLAITSLKNIADAFNVGITYFFTDIEAHDYATKKDDQMPFTVEGSDVTYTRLAGRFSNRGIEPMMVTLPANIDFKDKFSHPGEEFYFVLEGEVDFNIQETIYHLEQGESIHFPSENLHQWKNPTSEEARLLCLLTPALF